MARGQHELYGTGTHAHRKGSAQKVNAACETRQVGASGLHSFAHEHHAQACTTARQRSCQQVSFVSSHLSLSAYLNVAHKFDGVIHKQASLHMLLQLCLIFLTLLSRLLCNFL